MVKTIQLLKGGFESSPYKTEEFKAFARTFKSEFTKELKSVGAESIVFSVGHFYISGFFTVGTQAWYFSIPDVREADVLYNMGQKPKLLYRKATNYSDFMGGHNEYVSIREGMGASMRL